MLAFTDTQGQYMTTYDVITLGETMIRLTPPGFKRIEQTETFHLEVGGSESNTAVGLARLGLRVCWWSRLTDNPLGRWIESAISRHGVDTTRVMWTADDRVGLYFLEEGKAPRGSRVIYDRADSAASRMTPADLPADLFHPSGARLLHLTGITPALSVDAAATATHALVLAKQAGWRVSFDLNYRGKLWSGEAASAGCEPFMRAADLLLVPSGDARTVYGLDAEPEAVLSALAGRYPQATIVLTLGADGAMARTPAGELLHQPVFPAQEVDRLGGGDAFSAGLLYGLLTTDDLALALRWGAAVAALKYTIIGDLPLVERGEAEALVRDGVAAPKLAR